MDTYRTNFEKIKSSGMDRMLGYIDNSNSIIRDISNQKPYSLDRTITTYEQSCIVTNAKNKNSYLDTQECVKIPYMILSDPTNLLFGLDVSVKNPMDVYRISTTNYDQKSSNSRFLNDMTSNLNTLNEDIHCDTKTNLVSLAKKYTSFIDSDNIAKTSETDPLTTSILSTNYIINDDNIDPGNYCMNMFESETINPSPDINELLLDLTIIDGDSEIKLIPKLNTELKSESKPVDIKGSTIKPKVLDKESVRSHKPIIYGLSSEDFSLSINPTNTVSGTQTEDMLKIVKDNDVNVVNNSLELDEIMNNVNQFTRVQIGYRDTFDTTPKMMETYSKIREVNHIDNN